jgi:hypothetical protein
MKQFKGFLIITLIIICLSGKTQEKKNWRIKFSGFVNSQLFYNTRQMVDAREGMLSLFPKKPEFDIKGTDINEKSSLNHLSMTSRLKWLISGPDVLGAKLSGLIEGDFTGVSNNDNNGFRLRETWIKLSWKNTSLLVGQTWHPMNAIEIRPKTIGLNTGAPFHAFSRHNQIQLRQKLGHLKLILFAGMQRDYANAGPLGKSSIYQRNAAIPNFHFQMQYTFGKHIIGAGIDYKSIQPRNFIEVNNKKISVSKKLNTLAALAFASLNFNTFDIKLQAVWGENLSEHIMLGGYYENISYRGDITYNPSSQKSIWLEILTKGKNIKLGLFAGYAKHNLKTDKTIFYGIGSDIDHLYRISPRIQVYSGKLMWATEFEYTAAAYIKVGQTNTINVSNLRILTGLFYFF